MRRLLPAALVAAVLVVAGLLGGCNGDGIPSPGEAKIDVDTPQLRQLKADAGIEACVPGAAVPVDGGLPDVTLPCLGGGDDVELARLRGPLVVNLWGAWCGPCVKELPALAEFYGRYGDQVPLLGIDYQDPQTGSAIKLAKKSGVTYPLLADTQGDLRAKAPFAARVVVPSFLFVDADGKASLVTVPGGVDSADKMVQLVDEHLGISL